MINFRDYKIIVIKIGSSLIVDSKNNKLRISFIKHLAKDIKQLHKIGLKVVVVSSGSVACGCNALNINRKTLNLDKLQALASYGQTFLIEHYKKQFAKYGLKVSQMLITSEDCQSRRHYLNMRATIENLFELGIVPVINENDSTVTEEIRFGDNDNLSAQTAHLVNAGLLVILSDVSGLHDKNPSKFDDAKVIPRIDKITPEIINMAKSETSYLGTGGMASKVKAAQIAVKGGTDVVITEGKGKNTILGLEKYKLHSFFSASKKPISARKRWLSNLKTSKAIIIDDGAVQALRKRNSLLPVGVVDFIGEFARGDTVKIMTLSKKNIAVGMTSIDSSELKKMMGLGTSKIVEKYQVPSRVVVVHYDNLVLN